MNATEPHSPTGPLDVARDYFGRGWMPIPVPHKSKKPRGNAWQESTFTADDLPAHFNGRPQNVGVLTGTPSGGLVDVDLDAIEAVRAAASILPPTGSVFGRPGKPSSHWLYVADPIGKTVKFNDPVDGKMLVELRSTGCQTVMPGSTHEEGEAIAWVRDETPAATEYEYLHAHVAKVAAAAALARRWPAGAHHDASMALAGGLLRTGWDQADVEVFIATVATAARDTAELADRVKCVGTTVARLRSGGNAWGWTKLVELTDRKMVIKVREWLGATDDAPIASAFQRGASAAPAAPDPIPPCPTDEDLGSDRPCAGGDARDALLFKGPPIPLTANTPEMMPAGVLPGAIGEFAEAVANETETPLGLAVCNVLAALAVVCQKRFSVRPEPGYFEPLSIWTATAMGPGNRKTAAYLRVAGPLFRWESEQAKAVEEQIARAESELKTAKARIEQLRIKAAKADPAAYTAMREEIGQLESTLPTVPTPPRLLVDDVTVEHVATVMSQNGERIGVLADEGGIFDNIMGRYSSGTANVDVFNKGYSGSHVRVDRGSRPGIMLSHPAITFGVSVQPVIFAAIAKNERLRHSGFVDRFLFLLPPSRLGYRKLEQHPVPESLLDGWDRSVRDLAAVESLTDDEGEPTPHVLSFSAAAYGLWKAWQREVESMMREGGRLQHLAGWAGKLAGNTARIAGLLHCGERTFTAVAQREIQGDSVERAITLARVFLDHALVVFDLMGSDASSEGATALWGVITSRRDVEFSARDAWHPLRGKYKRVGDVEAGFQKLIDHNLIAEWGGGMAGKPGRPSRRFRVHPQVAEEWQ